MTDKDDIKKAFGTDSYPVHELSKQDLMDNLNYMSEVGVKADREKRYEIVLEHLEHKNLLEIENKRMEREAKHNFWIKWSTIVIAISTSIYAVGFVLEHFYL